MAVVPLRIGETVPEPIHGGIIAVGNFDGVHLGHAALIAAARKEAGSKQVVAVTFDPHPLVLLAPERYQPPLTTIEARARHLHEVGADHVVVLQTTRELLALEPEDFFKRIVRGALQASGMAEGFNFRFGHNRAGSNELLRQLCGTAGMTFREVAAFELNGKPVSSSLVRGAINEGAVAAARSLLNRHYHLTGQVVAGAKRGRTIGFPTANLEGIETLVPAEGVYAVVADTSHGRFAGAANLGPNPTFGEQVRKIEVHLLDFAGDLYGSQLTMEFVERLRGTTKFAGVDALKEQLQKDIVEVRRIGVT